GPVLAHRLLMAPAAAGGGRTAEHVVAELLATLPVPRGR
ncbi:MAG: ATPase, partial [Blastococcus sp.]|nr:ATPase [Blastococcus sp.]